MALIKWDNKYSVKVREMDAQHLQLIEMINDLHDDMKTGKAREIITPALKKMMAYTQQHLAKEEALMLKHSYPGYNKQKEQHQAFITKISELESKFDSGSVMVAMDIIQFLNTWFINHICTADAAYSDFFNQKGVN